MIQVREGMFETNSSSTSCLIVLKKSDYNKWLNDEAYVNPYDNKSDGLNIVVSKEEAMENFEEEKDKYGYENIDEYARDNDLFSPKEFDLDETNKREVGEYIILNWIEY